MDVQNMKELVGKLMRVNRLHRNVIQSRAGELQLQRSGHMMLLFIRNSKTPPSQKDIAEFFRITPAAVAMSLKKMEAHGLVSRITSESDARINLITVSEKGIELLDRTRQGFESADRAMLSGISEEELEIMSGTLDKMIENLIGVGATDDCVMMRGGEKTVK
jgi:DNA-binding MarR family transcriptional regulator